MSSSGLHDYMGKDYRAYYASSNDTRPPVNHHPTNVVSSRSRDDTKVLVDFKVERIHSLKPLSVDCEPPKDKIPVSTWSQQATSGCCIA